MTAEKTGVSKAMLGQIERGESSPTVATLWKISKGFEISLTSLIQPMSESISEKKVEVINAGKLRKPIADDDMLVATLQPFEDALGFELFEITFPAGYDRISEPHRAGVTEYITVIAGEMSIIVEGETHQLGLGDTLKFAGDLSHRYVNPHQEAAVVHCLMRYPGIS